MPQPEVRIVLTVTPGTSEWVVRDAIVKALKQVADPQREDMGILDFEILGISIRG